jgi:hypothetical protein
MRIGERVRAAHLSNHCPGGLGLTSSTSSGADADNAHAASRYSPDPSARSRRSAARDAVVLPVLATAR